MMSYRSAGYLFLACLLFVPHGARAAAPEAQRSGGQEVPAIKKKCDTCHRPHDMASATPGLERPVVELCIGCHGDRKPPGEHVVDIAPSWSVQDLPLTDGRMTCITCHDPHNNPYGKLLRLSPEELCQKCHRK